MNETRCTNMECLAATESPGNIKVENELAECKKKLACVEEQKSVGAENVDRENMDVMEKIAKVDQSIVSRSRHCE